MGGGGGLLRTRNDLVCPSGCAMSGISATRVETVETESEEEAAGEGGGFEGRGGGGGGCLRFKSDEEVDSRKCFSTGKASSEVTSLPDSALPR